jgi:AhpD family alkylhydroperoxidase
MEARMESPANADVTTAIQHLCKAMHSGGVDPLLLELVHLRASQINGCSPCVFAGVASATKQGRVRRAAAQRGDLVREALLHRGGAGCARPGPYFICGLFSMLNVLTGVPIRQLVEELPLAPSIVGPLVAEEGEIGAALHCARAYERGRWKEVNFCGLPHNVIRAAYVDAVFWAEETRKLIQK